MAEIFKYNSSIVLESGFVLPQFHLAYTTYGGLNKKKDNVVWIFHALTADSNPAEWWQGLVGRQRLFDPEKYFIVCANMPGSCYGSISPLDINVAANKKFYHSFPLTTIRDMVGMYKELKKYLGISQIFVGLGGSMGGQQLLEWAVEEPELFKHIIPIATNASHSPWAIAFNATQRFCIEADPTWKNETEHAGIEGMKTARAVALLSYRSYETYNKYQAEESSDNAFHFKSESYQRYQGEKLAKRFNAFSYYFLGKAMDSHNVGRQRISVKNALQKITAKALVIGIKTDILFPVEEQQFLADNITGAMLEVIDSPYGHDGFLLEFGQIERSIKSFLNRTV